MWHLGSLDVHCFKEFLELKSKVDLEIGEKMGSTSRILNVR
jgi:hypothetical protein